MSKFLDGLNEEQKKAVIHTGSPLLIVAGAGTGKTTVITRKIAYLINEKQIKPEEILALTFTEKATREMSERIEKLLPRGFYDITIATFHAAGERIVRDYAIDLGISPRFEVLNESAIWHLIHKNFEKLGLSLLRPRHDPLHFVQELVAHFSRAKDEAITPEAYLNYAENVQLDSDNIEYVEENKKMKEISHAYHAYQQILEEHNALDFGDLLLNWYTLLSENTTARKELQNRYTHILIDEFQDTNLIQYAIAKQMAKDGNNFTVVADDDQSIYKFRGASVENVMQFVSDYPKCAMVILRENYRSTQPILDCAHAFIKHNDPHRLEALPAPHHIDKTLQALRGADAQIELVHYTTQYAESQAIAETIHELHNAGVSYNECAVLTRSRNSAEEYARMIEHAGIPVVNHDQTGLYRMPIVLDILAFLKLIVNRNDTVSFHRVMRAPPFAISPEDSNTLILEAAKTHTSLFDIVHHQGAGAFISERGLEQCVHIFKLRENLAARAMHAPVSQIIVLFLEASGYSASIARLLNNEKTILVAERLATHLTAFMDDVARFEARNIDPHVGAFLEFVAVQLESGDEGDLGTLMPMDADAVQIMTMHAAKGLEFSHVFLPGLVHLRFPSIARRDAFELPRALIKEHSEDSRNLHIEEERRLMYVALTRAKDGLHLSYADNYGGKSDRRPSSFIAELGISITRKHDVHTEPHTASQGKTHWDGFTIPTSFSFTGLKAFETCPLQYAFKELLHLPVKGKGHMNFGTIIHKTLEDFYTLLRYRNAHPQPSLFTDNNEEKIVAPTCDELFSLYEKNWRNEWYESPTQRDEYHELGRRMLAAFYAAEDGRWTIPLSLEKKFELSLGDATIKGKIDRMDSILGGAHIIDYKTGKKPTDDVLGNEDKRQLLLYQIAAKESLGIEPKKLTYYYLASGSQMSFLGSDEEMQKVRKQFKKNIDAIRTGNFTATPSVYACTTCDYKDICEFRKL